MKNVIALCDKDAEYRELLATYLIQRSLPGFEVRQFGDPSEMGESFDDSSTVFVFGENVFEENMDMDDYKGPIAILNESGIVRGDNLRNINKFQPAEVVRREILELFEGCENVGKNLVDRKRRTSFVGIYSPVRRCFQTTFALALSRQLSMDHRTLYLNLEHFAGISEMLPDMQVRDLGDLLYFLNADEEKFRLRLSTITKRVGELDIVPPMKAGQNLLGVMNEEWIEMMKKIDGLNQYEFVVMDLSDCVRGLFEVLRRCDAVYTLTRDDNVSKSKLLQYEQVLSLSEYGDVLKKSVKLNVPKIKRLPRNLCEYSHTDIEDYVKAQIQDLLEKRSEHDGF
ncbi:MAG: hypothetical protein J6033_03980 [Lachnospiraceae bacterium]|nr:hypothetical protein [Lachnospiraceae bacterium]